MTDLGIGLSVIGIILGWVWYVNNKNNNRVIKEVSNETRQLIVETQQLIVSTKESTEKLLNEIDKRHAELLGRILEKVNK
ncbi:MAG: hypothetical protein QME68_04240 [Elusimicrobiota bacterium]|nr:hypothetical protein [Elusimicrobiota bacterium]